jgi:hypothetical protein
MKEKTAGNTKSAKQNTKNTKALFVFFVFCFALFVFQVPNGPSMYFWRDILSFRNRARAVIQRSFIEAKQAPPKKQAH